jgi:hypothetical protein
VEIESTEINMSMRGVRDTEEQHSAIDLLQRIGMEQVALHLQELSHYLLTRLKQIHAIGFLPGFGRCEEWCSPG